MFSALIVIINNSSICEFLSVSLITHSFQRFIFLPWWNEFFIELTSIYECFPASNFKTSPASYKGHFKWVDSRKDQKTVPAIVRILSLSPYNWHFVQLSCEQKHDRYFLEIIKFQKMKYYSPLNSSWFCTSWKTIRSKYLQLNHRRSKERKSIKNGIVAQTF